MSSGVEKLICAKALIKEVEEELIDRTKFCPYEIGYTLRNLEDAIEQVRKLQQKEEVEE